MEIRELNMSDIESVKRLMIDIFSVEPWTDVWTDDKLHTYIRELMGNENSLSFGVYQDEVLIGIALGRLKSWYEGTEYWIDEFGILPNMQQAGIGSGFMKSIEEKAAEKGAVYTNISPDYITNNTEREESNIYLESYSTELKGTQMRLTYEDGISDKEPKVLKPKQILFENPKEISFESGEKTERYDVYGYGELQDSYESAGEAIRAANEINGVVVSEDQQYIWERGNRDLQYTISGKDDVIENIRSRLSQGEAPVTIMEEVMGESLDLTGCTTEELLYVINQDRPVIAMLDAQNAVILVGYTDASVIYVNVSSGERSSVSYTEMDQMTAGSGSTYIG